MPDELPMTIAITHNGMIKNAGFFFDFSTARLNFLTHVISMTANACTQVNVQHAIPSDK